MSDVTQPELLNCLVITAFDATGIAAYLVPKTDPVKLERTMRMESHHTLLYALAGESNLLYPGIGGFHLKRLAHLGPSRQVQALLNNLSHHWMGKTEQQMEADMHTINLHLHELLRERRRHPIVSGIRGRLMGEELPATPLTAGPEAVMVESHGPVVEEPEKAE